MITASVTMSPDCICLFIIDNQRLRRSLLERALHETPSFSVLGAAGDALEAGTSMQGLAMPIDVAIVHLGPSGNAAILMLPQIHARFPQCRIVALDPTAGDARRRALAISSGASVVLTSEASLEDLVDAVRRAHKGESMITSNDLHLVLRDATKWRTAEERARAKLERLTPREVEILQALARGCSDKEMANDLGVKGKTVATHVANVLDKLEVTSRLQAALLAIRYGFVDITKD